VKPFRQSETKCSVINDREKSIESMPASNEGKNCTIYPRRESPEADGWKYYSKKSARVPQ
jgi:hypothetical protein